MPGSVVSFGGVVESHIYTALSGAKVKQLFWVFRDFWVSIWPPPNLPRLHRFRQAVVSEPGEGPEEGLDQVGRPAPERAQRDAKW